MEFLVLPDDPQASVVAAKLTTPTMRTVSHGSGLPWIIGVWADGELTLVQTADRRLALLGRASARPDALANRLQQARDHRDLDDIAREVPGSYHLIAAFGGLVRVQGTLSDQYRIYYADVDGVTVAADRPDRLVAATGAALDERALAACLLTPYSRAPWPISEHCLWRGIAKLAPAHYLTLAGHGTPHIGRWWYPPDPVVPLAEGAGLIRDRIIEAVGSRVDPSGAAGLSIDLSGGMDSTSLCYVADRLGIRFTSLHTASADPSNVDIQWATACHRDLRSAQHVVIPSGALPGPFDGAPPGPGEVNIEGPATLVNHRLIEALASRIAAAGADRHLRGDGADELFQPGLTYTSAIVRRRPLAYLSTAMRLKAANRWDTARTVRNLRYPGSYRRWLAAVAGQLTEPPDAQPVPGWELRCRLPPWATPAAVDLVRGLFDEASAAAVHPLVADPVQHGILRQVHLLGAAGRQCSQVGERYGVSFESPYLDLPVVEAALSIRFEDRAIPGVSKRVLAAAMDGITPASVLTRPDKSHATRDAFESLRRARSRLVELCADPQLARRGLVNAEQLRAIALNIHPDIKPLIPLVPTRATELWLQALSKKGSGTPAR